MSWLFFLVISLSSCFQKYYNTNTTTKTDAGTLEKLKAENKMFIVHTQEGVFVLKNPMVNDEIISGCRDLLKPKYKKYLNPVADTANKVKPHERDMVLNEVHLYTNAAFLGNEKINIEIGQIYRMDVYGLDIVATKKSSTDGIVGITLGVGLIIGIIMVAASNIHIGGYY